MNDTIDQLNDLSDTIDTLERLTDELEQQRLDCTINKFNTMIQAMPTKMQIRYYDLFIDKLRCANR